MPQTCVFCNILTIFRRISHLLGEELARIILWDDKTSRSGSSMLIDSRYLPGVAWEIQKAWSLKYGGKNQTSAQSTHGQSNDSQVRLNRLGLDVIHLVIYYLLQGSVIGFRKKRRLDILTLLIVCRGKWKPQLGISNSWLIHVINEALRKTKR